jgi:hypothetical protein
MYRCGGSKFRLAPAYGFKTMYRCGGSKFRLAPAYGRFGPLAGREGRREAAQGGNRVSRRGKKIFK